MSYFDRNYIIMLVIQTILQKNLQIVDVVSFIGKWESLMVGLDENQ